MVYLNKKVTYKDLNAKQKEIYNFQRVSGLFAEYGYTTIKLADDWMGADFIALGFDGDVFLKVQLKGRLTFDKKYLGKDIYICFEDKKENKWYLYPHDNLLKEYENEFGESSSWKVQGQYHFRSLNKKHRDRLADYIL